MESVPEGLVTMSGIGGGILCIGVPVREDEETVPAGSVSSPITVIICDGEPVRE